MRKLYILPKGTEPTDKLVGELITSRTRAKDVKHYNELRKYYEDGFITERPAPHKLLAITNYARYISTTNASYLLGTPVSYSASEGVNIDDVLEKYANQSISSLDNELESDASVYGHAFERVYINEDGEPESAKIDPQNVILVHDDTVKHSKMFAVIYTPRVSQTGRLSKTEFDITILTKNTEIEGVLENGQIKVIEETPHIFGEVPVIEYVNSSDRIGDFEVATSLIDARNILQSDRILDRERLVDAILAFYGTEFSDGQRKELKNSRILSNLPADAKVEYVVKNINEADASVLLKAITDDIHKVTMTPDMSDENFAGNSSGVALSYKLLSFENHAKDKERYFEKGLMERFKIYDFFLHGISSKTVSISSIDIIFTRSLPKNDLETSTMINTLLNTGLVDKETLAGLLSFVKDPKEIVAIATKEKEQEESDDFNGFGTSNPSDTEDEE